MNPLGSLRPTDCASPAALALATALAPCWITVWPPRSTGCDSWGARLDRRPDARRSAGDPTAHPRGGASLSRPRTTIDTAPSRPDPACSDATPDAPG
jgi:hypothetical protein